MTPTLAPMRPPNMVRVRHGVYIVRSQRGLNKAVRDFWCEADDSSADARQLLEEYPARYPCLIVLSLGYCGYHFIHCESLHLNELKTLLKSDDLFLRNSSHAPEEVQTH